MISELYLKNFVLIEEANLEFDKGLNIISGETGAGKSLLATALSIVLARRRFLTTHIRKGAEYSSVSAVFILEQNFISLIEQKLGLDLSELEEGSLVIERRMNTEGRGKTMLCGKSVAVSTLKAIGEILFDISAQDEHAYIRDELHQRDLLDSFAGCDKELVKVKDVYLQLQQTVELIRGGKRSREEKKAELERVRYEIDELELLAYTSDDIEIGSKITFLENVSQLKGLCVSAIDSLYESDNSASSTIGSIANDAEKYAEFSEEMKDVAEILNTVNSSIDEVIRIFQECECRAESDPDELNRLIDRKHAIFDCARKHSCSPDELPNILEKLKSKKEELSISEEEIINLKPKAEKLKLKFIKLSSALRKKRKIGAKKLDDEVKASLSVLEMGDAEFKIEVTPICSSDDSPEKITTMASSYGADKVIYTVRPNKGEEWGSVSETTSGGETTRIMLAIKSSLVTVNPCDILFFDEIDAGVGGKAGEAVAKQLEKLSSQRQVIAITHLPQIASYGNRHLSVKKETVRGRTRTTVELLNEDNRIIEIAEMIRGGKITKTTLKQAREMLDIR